MELLDHPFAAYPMVEEAAATGRVAGVYAAAAARMPFVPSLLKSLALSPAYLTMAWRQAAPMLDRAEFDEAADRVVTSARGHVSPQVEESAASVLNRFVGPLARMLLLTSGLHAALRGEISGPPASADPFPAPDEPLPAGAPSSYDVTDLDSYGRIRAALDTPIVNSIWRQLAADNLLAAAWAALEPHAPATREPAAGVRRRAYDAARALPWSPVASPDALRAAGTTDAAAGMETVLRAYLATLPRVLVLVSDVSSPSPAG